MQSYMRASQWSQLCVRVSQAYVVRECGDCWGQGVTAGCVSESKGQSLLGGIENDDLSELSRQFIPQSAQSHWSPLLAAGEIVLVKTPCGLGFRSGVAVYLCTFRHGRSIGKPLILMGQVFMGQNKHTELIGQKCILEQGFALNMPHFISTLTQLNRETYYYASQVP